LPEVGYAEKRRRIPTADAETHLVRITPRAPLPLVDLTDDQTLSVLDLDARVSVGDDYEACSLWALAFHERWPEVCGVAYAARWGGVRTTNVALFVGAASSRPKSGSRSNLLTNRGFSRTLGERQS
jgi:hypothetical protein